LAQVAEAARAYFRSGGAPKTADEMAAYYEERAIFGVLLAENWESTSRLIWRSRTSENARFFSRRTSCITKRPLM